MGVVVDLRVGGLHSTTTSAPIVYGPAERQVLGHSERFWGCFLSFVPRLAADKTPSHIDTTVGCRHRTGVVLGRWYARKKSASGCIVHQTVQYPVTGILSISSSTNKPCVYSGGLFAKSSHVDVHVRMLWRMARWGGRGDVYVRGCSMASTHDPKNTQGVCCVLMDLEDSGAGVHDGIITVRVLLCDRISYYS